MLTRSSTLIRPKTKIRIKGILKNRGREREEGEKQGKKERASFVRHRTSPDINGKRVCED